MTVVIRHGRLTGAAAFAWPDASNTGPTGDLETYAGTNTISSDGAIIQNVIYTGSGLTVTGNNVTIRNCQINCEGAFIIGVNATGLNCTIEDCAIVKVPSLNTGLAGIKGATTISRCDIYGWTNGIVMGAAATISGNYIHDLAADYSGIQMTLDVVGALIEDNTIVVSGSGTSCIFIRNDTGRTIDDVTVDHNYLGGAAETPISVTDPGSGSIVNLTITNNHIEEGSSGYIVISVADQSSFFIEGNVDALTGDPV